MKHQFFQLLTFNLFLLFGIASFANTVLAEKSIRYPDKGAPDYIDDKYGNPGDESAFVSSDLYSEKGLFYSKSEEGYPPADRSGPHYNDNDDSESGSSIWPDTDYEDSRGGDDSTSGALFRKLLYLDKETIRNFVLGSAVATMTFITKTGLQFAARASVITSIFFLASELDASESELNDVIIFEEAIIYCNETSANEMTSDELIFCNNLKDKISTNLN